MALLAHSENAEDIAAAFLQFKEPVSNSATEVTALVSELFAISAALLELDTALRDHPYHRQRTQVADDQYTVLKSLDYTFQDVRREFAGLSRPFYRTDREAFVGVWRSIERFFQTESNNSLVSRLEYYRLFIQDLGAIVQGYPPSRNMDDIRYRIERLLRVQELESLEEALDDRAVGAPRQPSWERMRPYGLDPTPNIPPPPREIRRRPRPVSFDYEAYGFPPVPVPDIPPLSPTATNTSSSTQSSRHDQRARKHWILTAFSMPRPTTTFTETGSESKCFGQDMPRARSALSDEYDDLLELPFEEGHLKMHIFVRPRDRRARLLCKTERGGHRIRSSYPVSQLRIVRSTSCLQICHHGSRGQLIMWTNLRFPSYERLVLFHCTFLALKALDEANPIRELQDHILDEEATVFSAEIIDDDYAHKLQILKDTKSRGLRLQASALRGPLKRAPIWTAFINYRIASVHWIWRPEPHKVHMGDLDRYVFTDDYVPQLAPNGAHEIYFKSHHDAKSFMDVIEDLASGALRI